MYISLYQNNGMTPDHAKALYEKYGDIFDSPVKTNNTDADRVNEAFAELQARNLTEPEIFNIFMKYGGVLRNRDRNIGGKLKMLEAIESMGFNDALRQVLFSGNYNLVNEDMYLRARYLTEHLPARLSIANIVKDYRFQQTLSRNGMEPITKEQLREMFDIPEEFKIKLQRREKDGRLKFAKNLNLSESDKKGINIEFTLKELNRIYEICKKHTQTPDDALKLFLKCTKKFIDLKRFEDWSKLGECMEKSGMKDAAVKLLSETGIFRARADIAYARFVYLATERWIILDMDWCSRLFESEAEFQGVYGVDNKTLLKDIDLKTYKHIDLHKIDGQVLDFYKSIDGLSPDEAEMIFQLFGNIFTNSFFTTTQQNVADGIKAYRKYGFTFSEMMRAYKENIETLRNSRGEVPRKLDILADIAKQTKMKHLMKRIGSLRLSETNEFAWFRMQYLLHYHPRKVGRVNIFNKTAFNNTVKPKIITNEQLAQMFQLPPHLRKSIRTKTPSKARAIMERRLLQTILDDKNTNFHLSAEQWRNVCKVAKMTERAINVVFDRFGLAGNMPLEVSEIAEKYNIKVKVVDEIIYNSEGALFMELPCELIRAYIRNNTSMINLILNKPKNTEKHRLT